MIELIPLIFLFFCVICLFVAFFMDREGKLVLFANKTDDVAMLALTAGILLIGGLTENSVSTTTSVLLYLVALGCFSFSAYYSVTKNKGNTFGIIITILAKIGAIMFVICVLIYFAIKFFAEESKRK